MAICRLCVHMYRAARAVAWNGVFAALVYTSRTLVPGCSIALWLLQLLMLTPVDEYVPGLPFEVKTPEFLRR